MSASTTVGMPAAVKACAQTASSVVVPELIVGLIFPSRTYLDSVLRWIPITSAASAVVSMRGGRDTRSR